MILSKGTSKPPNVLQRELISTILLFCSAYRSLIFYKWFIKDEYVYGIEGAKYSFSQGWVIVILKLKQFIYFEPPFVVLNTWDCLYSMNSPPEYHSVPSIWYLQGENILIFIPCECKLQDFFIFTMLNFNSVPWLIEEFPWMEK